MVFKTKKRRNPNSTHNLGMAILAAAKHNNLSAIEECITKSKRGQWYNALDSKTKNSAIHYAVIHGNLPMLQLLIQHGANVSKKNKDNKTPLILALEQTNRTDIQKELLEHDNSLTNVNVYIILAVTRNCWQSLLVLLEYANKHKFQWNRSAITSTQDTAIHLAVRQQHHLMVDLLIKNKANIHAKNLAGDSPLDLAIRDNESASLECILMISDNLDSEHLAKIKLVATKSERTLLLYDQACLTRAIRDNDLNAVKKIVNNTLLNQTLTSRKLTPLEIAIENNHSSLTEYLLLQGSRINKINRANNLAQTLLINYQTSESIIDDMIHKTKASYDSLVKSIQHRSDHEEMKQSETDYFANVKNILDSISQLFKRYRLLEHDMTINEKIDIYLLLKNLISMIETSSTKQELIEKFKLLLGEREDAILNSTLDYCYSTHEPANQLCFSITELLFSKGRATNQLLNNACNNDRQGTPWFDPSIGIEETELPHPTKLFRVNGNEIHLYQYVVSQTIARLKDNNKLLEHLWFGTDPKNITPVPPLNHEILTLLKQKSSTLRKLIEYTENLDLHTRMDPNIYNQFELLYKGLFAGDYRVTGSHQTAGAAAYAAIAKFADWWNRLQQTHPDIYNKILNLKDGHRNFAYAIEILFDQRNLNNKQRINDSTYCIHYKAEMIQNLLQNKSISEELRKMQTHIKQASKFNRLKYKTLDVWESQIHQELEEKPNRIILNTHGKFPTTLIDIELTTLLIKSGFLQKYSDLCIRHNKSVDTKYLISYIFSEKNNDNLLELQRILSHTTFNYLRKHGNNNSYFAFFEQKRVQTSQHYAYIQKALAEQMILNVTADKTTKDSAKAAVNDLCNNNTFIKCDITPTHWYSGFFTTEPYNLFNTRFTSLDSSKQNLNNEIKQLKENVNRLS